MSMVALWADRVSSTSWGRARLLISTSLPLPDGYCTTSTAAICPPAVVTCTCTGPHWVWTTSPVTVCESFAPDVVAVVAVSEVDSDVPVVDVVDAVDAVDRL